MKIEDLLRMAWKDGRRYGQGDTNLNFNDHINSTEYQEAIKLVKNNFALDVVICRCIKTINDIYGKPLFTKGKVYEAAKGYGEIDGFWLIDNNVEQTDMSNFEECFTYI